MHDRHDRLMFVVPLVLITMMVIVLVAMPFLRGAACG